MVNRVLSLLDVCVTEPCQTKNGMKTWAILQRSIELAVYSEFLTCYTDSAKINYM